MKKYLLSILFLVIFSVKAQLGDWKYQSSVRYCVILPEETINDVHSFGADFYCPISGKDFYLGGRLLLVMGMFKIENKSSNPLMPPQPEEKERKLVIYPEVTLRKYFGEGNIRPYAQAGLSYASSSLYFGIKPHIFLFELDLSIGYFLPFYKNVMEKKPYLPSGSQFMLGISVPLEVLKLEF